MHPPLTEAEEIRGAARVSKVGWSNGVIARTTLGGVPAEPLVLDCLLCGIFTKQSSDCMHHDSRRSKVVWELISI